MLFFLSVALQKTTFSQTLYPNNHLKSCFSICQQDSPDLMLLLRMLSLGQGAWDMIDSQVFKEPRLVCTIVTLHVFVQHLLSFVSVIVLWIIFLLCTHSHSGFGANDPLSACHDVGGCGWPHLQCGAETSHWREDLTLLSYHFARCIYQVKARIKKKIHPSSPKFSNLFQ